MILAQPETGIPDVFSEIADKGDCPAMAQAIRQLHELRRQDNFPTQALAKVILKDPGLSTKVLRVVNSAFFQTRGDPVTTISRAVVLLGIDTVVDLASGIVLVEHFDERDPALHESLMESLRAATLAQALGELANLPNPEEAYLLGLFSNLGRLWLAAHYREDLVRAVEIHAPEASSIEDAIKRHFGFSPDVLAAQILEKWGLPAKYSSFFRRNSDRGARSAIEDKLVLVAELSTQTDDVEFVEQAREKLNLSAERCRQVLASSFDSVSDHAEALGIGPPPPRRRKSAPRAQPRRVAAVPPRAAPASVAPPPGEGDAMLGAGEIEPAAASILETGLSGSAERRRSDAAFGMQAAAAIARAIVEREDLGTLLRHVLDGVARAGGFDAVVLYLADAAKENLTARLATGEGIAAHLGGLGVPLTEAGGIAAATLLDETARVVEAASPALLVPTGATPPDIAVQSIVTHPLCVRDRSVGVLMAMRGGGPPIDSTVLPTMQLFSQLAALAVDDRASARS